MIRERKTDKTSWLVNLILPCLMLLGWLISSAADVQAQPRPGANGRPPVVNITEVKLIGNAPPIVQVSWQAQVPPETTILKFNLRVTLNGGAAPITASAQPSERSATLRFRAGVVPQTFDATVETQFITPENGSVTTTRSFDLTSGAGIQGGVGSGGQLPPDRPVVQIASATKLSRDRFEIKWNVQAAPGIAIQRFGVSGLVTYQPKQSQSNPVPPVTRQTRISLATGSQRQAQVVVPDPPVAETTTPIRIEAKVETSFTAPATRTIQSNQQGRF